MSLAVTYAPKDDESGLGYYRRLVTDNILSNWRELAGLAGVQRNHSALLGHADFVASRLGLESAWTHFASHQDATCRGWGRLHRAQADAVCPACLAEDRYLRHYWEHTYVTACPKHRIHLVDQCHECGEYLSPHRYHIDQCDCGADLCRLPGVASTPAQHWLSTLIGTSGKQSGGVAPALHHVDTSSLAKLVRTLCLHADPTAPAVHRGAALPKSITEAVEFLSPLETLLQDWPTGFRSHVEQRIATGKQDARTLNSLLGPWYASLRLLCVGTALEPFIQVVIEVAAEKFDGVLGMDAAKSMAEEATDYVRLPDAARAIGVSASRLRKSMEMGECSFRTRRLGTRGQIYEIPRAEVARIQQRRAEWISDEHACELAGIPQSVLANMMAAKVVLSDVRWREDLFKAGQVERQSVLDLYTHVNHTAEPAAIADDAKLAWSALTSRRLGDKQAIHSLMQAIAAGHVRAVARGRTLGDMVFRRSDVAEYFGTPLLESGMSIQQLTKVTGWKWETVSHWIGEGLLDSESIQLRGQPCRVVLPNQLLAFRQTYVPLADLARAMGTKSSALSRLLHGIELVGAQRLSDGATRGGLVRIADLGRLAVIGARAGHDLFVPAA
ncbi:TniQ family protein [Paraburkholderia susongensis]|uniref:TniQ protein n=1 Tax=Paraburkholderia susongensis TaxID=1515439 RepID=A0A1X7K892_9BURK|nr:TniQ family protein [Paraburkholderia susongensis]SMG36924.1 TniQ protein [Paraburkholderia susongensis]